MGFLKAPAGGEDHPCFLVDVGASACCLAGIWGAFVDGNVLLLLDSVWLHLGLLRAGPPTQPRVTLFLCRSESEIQRAGMQPSGPQPFHKNKAFHMSKRIHITDPSLSQFILFLENNEKSMVLNKS